MSAPFPNGHIFRAAFCLVIAVAIGCGPSKVSTATRDSAPVPPREPVVVLNSATTVTPDATPNLLSNGSLEDVDEVGRPRGWGVSPAGLIAQSPGGDYDAFSGARSLTLRTLDDVWGVVFQDIRISHSDTPEDLFVTAQGRTPLNDYMRLSVIYKSNGQEVEQQSSWPACPDSWTLVTLRVPLQNPIDAGTVRIRVITRDEPGLVVRLDDVRVQSIPR